MSIFEKASNKSIVKYIKNNRVLNATVTDYININGHRIETITNYTIFRMYNNDGCLYHLDPNGYYFFENNNSFKLPITLLVFKALRHLYRTA